MHEKIGKSKDDILEALKDITFSFDSRHHYTDEDSRELTNDFFYLDVKIKVWFSEDLEDIIDKKVLDFGVYDYSGDEIDNCITNEEILNAININ